MSFVQDTIQNEAGEDITINIEVADTPDAGSWSETRSLTANTQDAFNKANALIRDCALNIAQTVQDIQAQAKPQEIEVQFAVKIDSTVGVMIAQSSMGAQLQVTLRWTEKDAEKHG
jgi:hypothetical protein